MSSSTRLDVDPGLDRELEIHDEPFQPRVASGAGLAIAKGVSKNTLRICHLGKFYPPAAGGMESHVQTLARAQHAVGASVRVVCVNHRDRPGQDVTWKPASATQTVEEWDGPVQVTRLGRRASLARLELCPDVFRTLRRLSRSSCDVLHLHLPNPCMLLALALCRPRLPLVITYHSDIVRQSVLRLALRPWEYLVLNKAVRILSTSPDYIHGSPLLQRYSEKVAILPFGIDVNSYLQPSIVALAYAKRLVKQHGSLIWLCVGRLVYYKGFQTAIEALVYVPGNLLIIGEGPLEADLRALAIRRGVSERITWLSRVNGDELVGAYHAARALWFPSNARSEAFGMVQVEAMASGCPVINTAIPDSGVAWVSQHDESGITVPVGDSQALAGAANRLLAEPGLRERLKRNGQARASRVFNQVIMAEKSLKIYRCILSAESREDHAAPDSTGKDYPWAQERNMPAVTPYRPGNPR